MSSSSSSSTGTVISDMARIKDNDILVVQNAFDKSSYILEVNGDQKLGKTRISLNDIIGEPYGSYFELHGRKFLKTSSIVDIDRGQDGDATEEPAIPTAVETMIANTNFTNFTNTDIHSYMESIAQQNASSTVVKGDNSFYVDSNTAQKLTDADISKLRQEGLTGDQVIKHLISNSATFGSKTDFAQEKWIKRKELKHRKKYQVLPSNLQTICETSYYKNREKICNMRYDSLAQVISQSGIHSGTHVLVVESMVGMLVGAIAYRMRGNGRILAMYGGQQPHFQMVKTYNLDLASKSIIEPIPAQELGPAAKDVCQGGFSEFQDFERPAAPAFVSNEEVEETNTEVKSEVEGTAEKGKGRKTKNNRGNTTELNKKKRKRGILEVAPNEPFNATGRTPDSQVRLRSYLRQGVDRLIIACKYRPLPILKQALYLLAPSSPFVIYHEFMEPLIDCYLYLQEQGLALRMVLFDSWLREFQTLPGRLRPEMFMTTSGGYILSGIYVGMVPCKYPFSVNNPLPVEEEVEEDGAMKTEA